MIAGMQIAAALSKLIGRGKYDPNFQPASGKLPATMRDLLEGKFDGSYSDFVEGGEDSLSESRQSVKIEAGGASRIYKSIPIRSQQFASIKRPDAPFAVMSQDFRGYYPVISAFYGWLKNKKMTRGINLDHPVLCKNSSLLKI
jgi:hypothetical protein